MHSHLSGQGLRNKGAASSLQARLISASDPSVTMVFPPCTRTVVAVRSAQWFGADLGGLFIPFPDDPAEVRFAWADDTQRGGRLED
jgi:hypothetical protein